MEKVPNNSSENIKEGKNESGWDDLENYEAESADEQSAESTDSREYSRQAQSEDRRKTPPSLCGAIG